MEYFLGLLYCKNTCANKSILLQTYQEIVKSNPLKQYWGKRNNVIGFGKWHPITCSKLTFISQLTLEQDQHFLDRSCREKWSILTLKIVHSKFRKGSIKKKSQNKLKMQLKKGASFLYFCNWHTVTTWNLQLSISTVCNIFIILCKHILERSGKYKLFLLGALKLHPTPGKSNQVQAYLPVPAILTLQRIMFFQVTYPNHCNIVFAWGSASVYKYPVSAFWFSHLHAQTR